MRLVSERLTVLSPWVTVVAKTVERADGEAAIYHSLRQADYVNVLAIMADGRVAMVRQYRPAVDKVTLELPGGLRESNEEAVLTAERELYEEVGLRPDGPLLSMGCFDPDYGRLENKFWAFFAPSCTADPAWTAEAGVERVFLDPGQLKAEVLDGRVDHAPHLAIIALAILRGFL